MKRKGHSRQMTALQLPAAAARPQQAVSPTKPSQINLLIAQNLSQTPSGNTEIPQPSAYSTNGRLIKLLFKSNQQPSSVNKRINFVKITPCERNIRTVGSPVDIPEFRTGPLIRIAEGALAPIQIPPTAPPALLMGPPVAPPGSRGALRVQSRVQQSRTREESIQDPSTPIRMSTPIGRTSRGSPTTTNERLKSDYQMARVANLGQTARPLSAATGTGTTPGPLGESEEPRMGLDDGKLPSPGAGTPRNNLGHRPRVRSEWRD